MTAKPKKKNKNQHNRLREVIILTFIFLPPLHLNGQKSSQVTSSQTQSIAFYLTFFFMQEMLKYHSNVT